MENADSKIIQILKISYFELFYTYFSGFLSISLSYNPLLIFALYTKKIPPRARAPAHECYVINLQ